jgi:transposase
MEATMKMELLLPEAAGLSCVGAQLDRGAVTLDLVPTSSTATCPCCGFPAHRIHSRYRRLLNDLPLSGTPVRLEVWVRRFLCETSTCRRQTFVEPLASLADPHARKTRRLSQALCRIGLALGGQAGARLAGHLGMGTSGDTILRLIRRAPIPSPSVVLVLGVDDWAWHKGQRCGTILCDLERHRPVDLLPERSGEDLARWLQLHPGVQVIVRDRSGPYARGATAGAPQAVQVADRYHLLCNLRETLVRTLERHRPELRQAAQTAVGGQPPSPAGLPELPVGPAPPATPSLAQQAKAASRSRRLDRYQEVVQLHQQGVSRREIARRMGMHRGTVRRFLRAGQFPERATRKYLRQTDRFVDYLRQRWDQGCHNAAQLAKELAQRGYTGSYCAVRRRVAAWREMGDAHTPGAKPTPKPPSPPPAPSPEQAAWLLLAWPRERSAEEAAFADALCQQCLPLKVGVEMTREFARMVQNRQAASLDDWIQRTHETGVPRELAVFADGLLQDHAAVQAALTVEWSNGQVEGQINRLKMIKRQMYGRAGFELLRQRVLLGTG